MGTREEILALAREHAGGKPNGTEQVDLFGAFGLEGDDADEFLEAYVDKYNVDMSDFRWEFHYIGAEPPIYRRVLPVDASGKVIAFIPITLAQLERAAEIGKWRIAYPEHTIRYSWWSKLAPVLLGLVVVGLIFLWFEMPSGSPP